MGLAKFDCRPGRVADGCGLEVLVQQLQRRQMNHLGDFPGSDDPDAQGFLGHDVWQGLMIYGLGRS